jgi:hypothetical protein
MGKSARESESVKSHGTDGSHTGPGDFAPLEEAQAVCAGGPERLAGGSCPRLSTLDAAAPPDGQVAEHFNLVWNDVKYDPEFIRRIVDEFGKVDGNLDVLREFEKERI